MTAWCPWHNNGSQHELGSTLGESACGGNRRRGSIVVRSGDVLWEESERNIAQLRAESGKETMLDLPAALASSGTKLTSLGILAAQASLP